MNLVSEGQEKNTFHGLNIPQQLISECEALESQNYSTIQHRSWPFGPSHQCRPSCLSTLIPLGCNTSISLNALLIHATTQMLLQFSQKKQSICKLNEAEKDRTLGEYKGSRKGRKQGIGRLKGTMECPWRDKELQLQESCMEHQVLE